MKYILSFSPGTYSFVRSLKARFRFRILTPQNLLDPRRGSPPPPQLYPPPQGPLCTFFVDGCPSPQIQASNTPSANSRFLASPSQVTGSHRPRNQAQHSVGRDIWGLCCLVPGLKGGVSLWLWLHGLLTMKRSVPVKG